MIKFLVNYLLVLTVFLSGGLSHLAHSHGLSVKSDFSFSDAESTFFTNFQIPKDQDLWLKAGPFKTESRSTSREFFEVEEEEEKDERERISSKTLEKSHYLTSIYTSLPGDYFCYLKRRLSFKQQVHCSAPIESLNILHCSFLI